MCDCSINLTLPMGPIGPAGPQGAAGTGTVINTSYASILITIINNGLQPGQVYNIVDYNIYAIAITGNTLAPNAILKATNVDYQNVTGNFLGVWKGTTTLTYSGAVNEFNFAELVTGGTSGAIGEVVINSQVVNGVDYSVILIISKNGIAFQVGETITGASSGAIGVITTITTTSLLGGIIANSLVAWDNIHYKNLTGTSTIKHPKYDTTNWVALATSDTSYQIEYDPVIFDFGNAKIIERKDKRGNQVTQTLQYTDNSIANFQWGRDTCTNNVITGSQFYGANAQNAQRNMLIQDSRVLIYEGVNVGFSIITSRTTALLYGTGTSQVMNLNHANVTIWGSGNANNLRLERFGSILLDNGCSAADCNFTNADIRCTGSTRTNGTTVLSACIIDGGSSFISKTFTSENHTNRTYKREVKSTFQKSITQASGTTALTLDTSAIYGRYYLTITGGGATITTIVNTPTEIPVEVVMAGSNQIILVHNTGATNPRLDGGLNTILKATTPDWIELTNKNSVIYQTNIGQY